MAAKLFAILDAFMSPTPSPALTLTAIAARAGLPLSTAHRLVAEWVRWGGLTRSENGRYTPGTRPCRSALVWAAAMLNGRRIVGVTEGASAPQLFLPALMRLIEQGRFPLHKLVRKYGFERINDGAAEIKDGSVLKPVLQFTEGG